MKADDVVKEFHRHADYLMTDETHTWLDYWLGRDIKRFSESGSTALWATWGPARTAEKFQVQVRKDFFSARMFQVTEEMVDLITGSWEHGKSNVTGLVEEHLPFPYAWAWLDKPWVRMGSNGTQMSTRVLSWGTDPNIPGVRIVFWRHTRDLMRDWTASMRDRWLAAHDNTHHLVYDHSAVVPFGAEIRALEPDGDNVLPWVKILWALMDAEISTEREARPSPYNMKRHREMFEGKEPTVTVILLRRTSPRLPDDDAPARTRMIDWSQGRIVVQGHHRHIRANYAPIPHHHAVPDKDDANKSCVTCGNEITWVKGYLKGPDGLPIRNAEQLWRLSR